MTQTPLAHVESLRIGTIDFVSPNEVKVQLDIEAPESVAINAGGIRPFPRVHGYVLVPLDEGYLVGQIEWLTVERSPFPKRRGVKDFGLVDLPYPLRKMCLNPLGILRQEAGVEERYSFRRGAGTLPSIGSAVLLPSDRQLRAIVESGERRRVQIGNSPLAGNASICIDPDRLFGRHLAVLGNTGSGKSCSVAGLIRWSLEAAAARCVDGTRPNARFVLLDPNGEYSKAFSDHKGPAKARVFRVAPTDGHAPLRVPLWFWNSAEWAAFTKASARTQRPVLVQALRAAREGHTATSEGATHELRRFLRTLVVIIRGERNNGNPWGVFPKNKSFFEKLEKWRTTLESDIAKFADDQRAAVQSLVDRLETLCSPKRAKNAHFDFTREEVEGLLVATSAAHASVGGSDADTEPLDVDSPRRFAGDALLRHVEAAAEMMGVSDHVETLLIRLRALLSDRQMKAVIGDDEGTTLEAWLEQYIGGTDPNSGCIAVVDLSLVPAEIVHVITAVTTRIIFEALQRYRRVNKETLPTVLVMEEAHTFVKRYTDDVENETAAAICCQVFERVAREGRKFGLGLVLSSQRPAELSPTVLSQCNSFLLHRISNDRDQEMVHRLLPDNLRGLLRELPALPSQQAILLGWASELPVLVRMHDLPRHQQPHSNDPDFWNVWTGRDVAGEIVERAARWANVAADWQGSALVGSDGDVPAGEQDAPMSRTRARDDDDEA